MKTNGKSHGERGKLKSIGGKEKGYLYATIDGEKVVGGWLNRPIPVVGSLAGVFKLDLSLSMNTESNTLSLSFSRSSKMAAIERQP